MYDKFALTAWIHHRFGVIRISTFDGKRVKTFDVILAKKTVEIQICTRIFGGSSFLFRQLFFFLFIFRTGSRGGFDLRLSERCLNENVFDFRFTGTYSLYSLYSLKISKPKPHGGNKGVFDK